MSKYHRLLLLTVVLVIAAIAVVYMRPMRKGLDLAGGIRVVLQAQPGSLVDDKGKPLGDQDKSDKMLAVIKTIVARVGGIKGVAEPVVQRQGDDRVIVELPGIRNKKQALENISSTARLEFYWLRNVESDRNPSAKWQMLDPELDAKSGTEIYSFRNKATDEIVRGDSTQGQTDILFKVINIYDKKLNPNGEKPMLTGDDLKPNAKGDLEQGTRPIMLVEMKPKGAQIFADFTRRHIGDKVAIILSGKILTAPRIESAIPNGRGQITGFSSLDEAQQRAQLLNSGALPVPLQIIQLDDVEATLGTETVNQALLAGIIGLALVLAFMLLYYRLPGLLADVALAIYALLTFSMFKLIGVTMTLPGLAGFILSIGMAVDANILIFERLKEELRSGKTLHASIDAGFVRAFTAIFDSNMCTAITAVILMWYGSGAVQSFALTLLIGVAISMFTAITVTRTFLHLLVSQSWAQNPKLFGLGTSWFHTWQPNVIGRRNWFFALSAVVILPGLFYYLTSGLKPGIEFKSGTSLQMTFESARIDATFKQPLKATVADISNVVTNADEKTGEIGNNVEITSPNTAVITAALNSKDTKVVDAIKANLAKLIGPTDNVKVEFSGPTKRVTVPDVARVINGLGIENTVQMSGKTTAFIRTSLVPKANEAQSTDYISKVESIQNSLQKEFGLAKISTSTVGPVVSAELTKNAIIAVILAGILIILYLSFRFSIGGFVNGFKYGTCAIIATFHDVLLIIGIFAMLGHFLNWEIDTLFVTAVLTIIGFSTHDTIVVFDRIRENLRHRLKGEDYEGLANRSILQTFSRSINTSFTVLLTIAALTVLGGPLIRHFYVALLVGIVSGTYSSIFNATPLLVVWEGIAARRKSAGTARRAFEDRPMVAADRARDMKPVARSAKAPSNGSDAEAGDTESTTTGGERVKVRPKRKKRRY